jgi:hypothetical protein
MIMPSDQKIHPMFLRDIRSCDRTELIRQIDILEPLFSATLPHQDSGGTDIR